MKKKERNLLGKQYHALTDPGHKRAYRLGAEMMRTMHERLPHKPENTAAVKRPPETAAARPRHGVDAQEIAALLHDGARGILNSDTVFAEWFDRITTKNAPEHFAPLRIMLRRAVRERHHELTDNLITIETVWVSDTARSPYQVIVGRDDAGDPICTVFTAVMGRPRKSA